MHRHAQVPQRAHARERLRQAQAAPVVVVRQQHLDRAHLRAAAEVVQRRDHHVGRERQLRVLRELGHAGQPRARVFVVLEQFVELRGRGDAGGEGPVRVRVQPQRQAGQRRVQRAHAGDLVRRREHAALQLDAAKAVQPDHALRLRDHLRRRVRLAPGVRRVELVDVFGVLEEQVGAVGHRVAHLAAEQVDDRCADELALQVEHRDLERADHLGGVLRTVRAGREFELDRPGGGPDRRTHALLHRVEREGREPEHEIARLLEHREHRRVAVGLGDADALVVRLQLDDRAQRPGFVDAGGVQQRAVAEGDRRDAHGDDAQVAEGLHGGVWQAGSK